MAKVIKKSELNIYNYKQIKENLLIEIDTGDKYRVVLSDEPSDQVHLIEPDTYDENIKKVTKQAETIIAKLVKDN